MTSTCGLNLLTQDVVCVCEKGCVSVRDLIQFRGTMKCERCNYPASSSNHAGSHVHTLASLTLEIGLDVVGKVVVLFTVSCSHFSLSVETIKMIKLLFHCVVMPLKLS